MSDEPTPAEETAAEQAVAKAEAAATRRRWITLGEIVAVAAVVISGLTFWNSWSERQDAAAERQAERAAESKEKAASSAVLLTGSAEDDGAMLTLSDPAHRIQQIEVRFPKALGVGPQTSVLEPQIQAAWIAAPMLKLTDGGADRREGRLPVAITASYWDADVQRTSTAIYDLVWRTEPRTLQGRTLKLRGVILRERAKGDGQARIDGMWKAP
jgi:hypothetical protein